MATTYLNSPNGTGTDPQIATFSMWFKLTKPEANEVYLFSGGDGGSNNSWLRVQGNSGKLYFRNRTSSSNDCVIQTEANHLDQNGWYHVVLKLNSTLSTVADRAIMYINGQEVTTYASSTDMTQNNLFHMFGATTTHIGKRVNDGSTGYIGGFLASHVHFCDGYAYDASAFGSTDSTTGEWKINTSPSVTYGTRGFFILKDGNSLTDQSTNTNNFTVGGGTLTKTEDCPSNVFATLNPLSAQGSSITFSKGNNQVDLDAGGSFHAVYSTIGATSGKYYAECLVDAVGTSTSIGIISADTVNNVQATGDGDYMGKESDSIGYVRDGEMYKANNLQQTIATYTNSDIISLAFDLDNNTIQFYKNGSSVGNTVSLTANKTYMIGGSGYNGSRQMWNFGNGFFGTTAVTSAGTNASGNGIFEYDVPTGYTALSTKGLNL